MCPMVNTDDLCDSHEVAQLLGLSHPNSVFGYLRRYSDLPRPVIRLGRGRTALWLRPEIVAWRELRPTPVGAMSRLAPTNRAGAAAGRSSSVATATMSAIAGTPFDRA